jgi:curved DNA-binding protein CbpA
MRDYYAMLGIPPDAEPEEVKQAFRKLAQLHHPDVGGDQATFMALKEAYDTLIDPDLRASYDIEFVEAFPGYSLIDADTGEDLIVEYEDEGESPRQQYNHYQQQQASHSHVKDAFNPRPQPDSGKGLLMLVVIVLPVLGFGFGMAITGDPLNALIIAGFVLVAMVAVAALVRERI